MITAQWVKSNGGLYRYYRCTRKQESCKESYIQEQELKRKIIEKAQTIALPTVWANEMFEYFDKEEKKEAQTADAFVQEINKKLVVLQDKLEKLLEGYLDNLINEETYKRKKKDWSNKKSP